MKGQHIMRQLRRGIWLSAWIVGVITYHVMMGVLIGLTFVAVRGRS